MIFQLGFLDEISEVLQQLKELFGAGVQEFQESPQNVVPPKGLFYTITVGVLPSTLFLYTGDHE